IAIVTLDAERGTISPAYVDGTSVPGWGRGSTHALQGSGIERVVEEQESLLLTRGATLSFPRYAVQEGDGVPPLRSAIVVPLVADDLVIAVLEVARSEPDGYSARDRALLQRVSAQIAGAFANARLHEQTIRLARERELRQRLDQEKRELERVNEEKSKFLSTVSHELKTPLASILALAEVLMKNRQGNLQDRQVEHIQVIHRSGRRLGVLINDLVDMSRIDSGQLTLDVAPFDTLLLFDELIPAFMPILATRHQTFKLALPLDPLWIEADRDRVEQVVTNIISNASKYSPDAAVIELSAAAVDGRLEVTVRDHGIGISEEDQRQLFTAFFRAGNKETRNVPGTGLGLVIAKSLVEMHDGEIRLESERGRGTTVTFSLPNVLPGRPETDEEADHPLWSRRVYREQDFAAD
ncbi:MAG: HAMP domain-containing sensor histidine kinase, partial [Dehalococcoidia bacterium]